MLVTLCLPIKVHGGSVRVFQRRNVAVTTPPRPAIYLPTPMGPQILGAGTLYKGLNIPDMLAGKREAHTMAVEVIEDLDTNEVRVMIQGTRAQTYTAEEYLQLLGEGWELTPPETTVSDWPFDEQPTCED